jgi:hypothetical protein
VGLDRREAVDWFGVMWGAHDSERTDRLKPDFTIHKRAIMCANCAYELPDSTPVDRVQSAVDNPTGRAPERIRMNTVFGT